MVTEWGIKLEFLFFYIDCGVPLVRYLLSFSGIYLKLISCGTVVNSSNGTLLGLI